MWILISEFKQFSKQDIQAQHDTQKTEGHGVESHWHHCVVSLSKTHLSLLSTGSTQEDSPRHITEKLLTGT